MSHMSMSTYFSVYIKVQVLPHHQNFSGYAPVYMYILLNSILGQYGFKWTNLMQYLVDFMVVFSVHRFDDQTLTIWTTTSSNIEGTLHLKSPAKYIKSKPMWMKCVVIKLHVKASGNMWVNTTKSQHGHGKAKWTEAISTVQVDHKIQLFCLILWLLTFGLVCHLLK